MKLIVIIVLFQAYFAQSYYYICTPCKCSRDLKENALITANCNQKEVDENLETIPGNIDRKIQVLYFKDQFLTEISSQLNKYSSLQELYLNRNNISKLIDTPFHALYNLTKLDLSFNKISELHSYIFDNNPKLVYLWLNNNNIQELPSDLFSNLPVLSEIHLQENLIHRISKNTFNGVPQLSTVDLSKNQLETLQLDIIDDSKSIQYLILHGNPWICNSSLCIIRETALNNNWLPSTPFCQLPQQNSWKELRNNSLEITTQQNLEDLDLICEYYNCLSKTLIWTLNNQTLLSHQTNKLVFTLKNITKSHQGLYTCSVLDCQDCNPQKIYLKVKEKIVISCNNTCEPVIRYNNTSNATKSSSEPQEDSFSWTDFGFGALAGLLALPALCLSLSLACGLNCCFSCCFGCCNCCSNCCYCKILKWILKTLSKMFKKVSEKLDKRHQDMTANEENIRNKEEIELISNPSYQK